MGSRVEFQGLPSLLGSLVVGFQSPPVPPLPSWGQSLGAPLDSELTTGAVLGWKRILNTSQGGIQALGKS